MRETPKTLQDLRALAERADTVAKRAAVLESAAVFAFFTVQDRTDKAEARFTWWHGAGRPVDAAAFPAGLGVRFPRPMTKQLASIRAFVSDDVLVDTVWALAQDGHGYGAAVILAQQVTGLSCAKASFVLALAGIGRTACLDVHVVRQHSDILADILTPTEIRAEKAPSTWSRYLRAADALGTAWGTPDDHAAGQWSWWFAHRAEQGLGHEEHEPYSDVIREVVGR